jgi:hypothetical protein
MVAPGVRASAFAAPVLLTLLCSCTATINCWTGELPLTREAVNEADWQLIRVNPDGSVVARHAGAECVLAPPDSPSSFTPKVVASSCETQSATLRVRWCTRTLHWGWTP